MKVKMSGLMVVALHVVVLAFCLQMQGCKTVKSGDVTQDQPVVLPAEDSSTGGILPVGGTVVPSVPSTGSAEKTYTVKKGDTLSSIASANGTTWKKLADSNNLSKPNDLKVGQEIRISGTSGAAAPATKGKRSTPVSSRPIAGSIKQGSSYVVQKGDMLSSIAKRSGLTIAEIKAANSLKGDSLVVGKSLTIPKKGAVVKAPAKAATSAPAKSAAVAPAMPAPAPLAEVAPAVAAATGAVSAVVAPIAASIAAPVAKVAAAASAPVYEHVLYPGETLDDVARQYGSSQQEIIKLNNITDPASIKPGTKLLVPIPE